MGNIRDKKADLAGPGIGDYKDVKKILPNHYTTLLNPKEVQMAITAIKNYIEESLCKELNLIRVGRPLIVDRESGRNDLLHRDGCPIPIQFHRSNDYSRNVPEATPCRLPPNGDQGWTAACGNRGEAPHTDMCAP